MFLGSTLSMMHEARTAQPIPVKKLGREERHAQYRVGVNTMSTAFFVGALAARLAEVDGPVNREEMQAAGKIFSCFGAPTSRPVSLLIHATYDKLSTEHYTQRLKLFFNNDRKVYRDLMQKMFAFALADGPMKVKEITWLYYTTLSFDLTEQFFIQQMRLAMLPQGRDAYQILGVSKRSSHDEIKKAYHKAMSAYHPDKLLCLGCADVLVTMANQRVNMIREAYDVLKKRKK